MIKTHDAVDELKLCWLQFEYFISLLGNYKFFNPYIKNIAQPFILQEMVVFLTHDAIEKLKNALPIIRIIDKRTSAEAI